MNKDSQMDNVISDDVLSITVYNVLTIYSVKLYRH